MKLCSPTQFKQRSDIEHMVVDKSLKQSHSLEVSTDMCCPPAWQFFSLFRQAKLKQGDNFELYNKVREILCIMESRSIKLFALFMGVHNSKKYPVFHKPFQWCFIYYLRSEYLFGLKLKNLRFPDFLHTTITYLSTHNQDKPRCRSLCLTFAIKMT